jgi:uncharacterized membrane protein (UPF0127 family)
LLLLAGCASGNGKKEEAPVGKWTTEIRFEGEGGRAGPLVKAEVVASDAARAKGLMFRKEVADGEGMLFVFEEEKEHPFWMKNTLVSLDMIWVDSSRAIVGIVRETKPLSEESVTVGVKSRFVIEVPAGWCTRNGVHRGQKVSFTL